MSREPRSAPSMQQPRQEASAVDEAVASLVRAALRALHALVEGTARGTGQEFFQSLVRHLAHAIDVHYAFVAEFTDVNTRVRTLAHWSYDRIGENFEFDLPGTPCENVVRGLLCHHPVGVKDE